jgi:hypothetical protein
VQSEADDQQQWSEWPWLTARLSKARIELRRQEAWQGEALGSGWCSPVGTGLRSILELSTDALMLAAPLLGCVCVCTMPARSPQLCWLTSVNAGPKLTPFCCPQAAPGGQYSGGSDKAKAPPWRGRGL